MTAQTAANRGAANRRRGIEAERAAVRWFREHGFPHAERTRRAGFRSGDRAASDEGDLDITPGVVVSVKAAQVERVSRWMRELYATCTEDDVGLLLQRRKGHADPGQWWCWMTLGDLAGLLTLIDTDKVMHNALNGAPVRMTLLDAVGLLRQAGYGEALADEAALYSYGKPPR